jgi:hypothetical protein
LREVEGQREGQRRRRDTAVGIRRRDGVDVI